MMSGTRSWNPIKCSWCGGFGIVDKGWLEVSPEECDHCAGGVQWVHARTGTVAAYPGGPLQGRIPPQLESAPDVWAETDEDEQAA